MRKLSRLKNERITSPTSSFFPFAFCFLLLPSVFSTTLAPYPYSKFSSHLRLFNCLTSTLRGNGYSINYCAIFLSSISFSAMRFYYFSYFTCVDFSGRQNSCIKQTSGTIWFVYFRLMSLLQGRPEVLFSVDLWSFLFVSAFRNSKKKPTSRRPWFSAL